MRQIAERGVYRLNISGRHQFVVATPSDEDGVQHNLHTLAAWGNCDQVSYYLLDDGSIVEPTSGLRGAAVADEHCLFDLHSTAEYADADNNASVGDRVIDRLGINNDQLNSLFAFGPVRGYSGLDTAKLIRNLWELDPQEPLGYALECHGVLSADEAAWLDDTE